MAKQTPTAAPEGDGEGLDESLFPDAAEFEAAEQLWGEGVEEATKSRPLGTFPAEIVDAVMERSSSSGNLQIHYELKILSGQYAGVVLQKYDGLNTPQRAAITQGQLKRVGIDPKKTSLRTLPASLLQLKAKKVVLLCREKNDFYNILFQKLVEGSVTQSPAVSKTAAPAKAGVAGKKRF